MHPFLLTSHDDRYMHTVGLQNRGLRYAYLLFRCCIPSDSCCERFDGVETNISSDKFIFISNETHFSITATQIVEVSSSFNFISLVHFSAESLTVLQYGTSWNFLLKPIQFGRIFCEGQGCFQRVALLFKQAHVLWWFIVWYLAGCSR